MLLPRELDIVEAGKKMPLPLAKPVIPDAVAAKGDGKTEGAKTQGAKTEGTKPESKPEAKKAAPKARTQAQPAQPNRTRPRI
jgi:hypothetical protein